MDRPPIPRPKFASFVVSPGLVADQGPAGAAAPARNVIIELNLDHRHGRTAARERVEALLARLADVGRRKLRSTRQHVFASLTPDQMKRLVELDRPAAKGVAPDPTAAAIHKIWEDRPVRSALDRSGPTIKADACRRTFGGGGEAIVWAVVDSGIDGGHAHFRTHATLAPEGLEQGCDMPPGEGACGLRHVDFTDEAAGDPLVDELGHGTHVAGIIAGATPAISSPAQGSGPARTDARRLVQRSDTASTLVYDEALPRPLAGVAPLCKLLSLKVMSDAGGGGHFESAVLAALDYVARANDDGRRLRVHGVNLSLSLDFDPRYHAAGQSPVCVAVNRLVEMGVVVVAAAGNAGSAYLAATGAASALVGLGQSITDPGNSELAITVGSTHAEAPHTYGISHFSSRGPTVDGREKPDLVAPGERIVSCASARWAASPPAEDEVVFFDPAFTPAPGVVYYRDATGTSMATPHVSGAAALILSVRREFIGAPRELKAQLMANATSLGRRRDDQGAGLVDALRTLQAL